jgi:ribosomal protein L11 methylase PrmA
MYRIVLSTVALLSLILSPALYGQQTAEKEATEQKAVEETRTPDVVFVPTPQEVVDKMLELAEVTKKDLVYDLGCGDGRIVVTAAKKYGCRAVGFDVDPERIKDSLENVEKNKVEKLVTIQQKDIFKLDLSKANVITLYLLPSLNVKLIPQLEKLKPGSRIVSHDFSMRGVTPDKVIKVTPQGNGREHTVYLWTVPLKKEGEEATQKKVAEETRTPDVVFVPTPQEVVDEMLKLAKVTKKDLVYDLGCGDGRIVVTAAKKYGCTAVGFDVDPQRIKESQENVKKNKVEKLVTIERKDIFKLDLSKANVITLYLLPSLNVKLIPQLDKLKPGSRIVSHDFNMRGVTPDKRVEFTSKEDEREHIIYLWTTPLKKEKKKESREKAAAVTP